MLVTALLFVNFLEYHQVRTEESGWLFNDPVFNWLPHLDCSVAIFSITYGALILFFITHKRVKLSVSKLMMAYAILLLVRMLSLYLIPLKTPESLIYLQDPFLNNLVYPGRIDADLFFSGHTALLFLMYFISRNKLFTFLGVAMAILLVIQHVHYSIDVIAAVPFAYLIVRITEYITSRIVRIE